MTPMLIHCVGLTALASSASAFAAPAAAAPLAFPPSADSVDGLTSAALPPNTPAGLSGTATLTQTLLDSAQTSRSTSGGIVSLPPDFFRHHVGPPHSSVLRVRTPQPTVQSGSVGGGNLLTFFVGGEPVVPLTEDQTLDLIQGTSWVPGALPFYVYVTHVQQQVQVRDTTISTDVPAISTDVLGGVIGGLAGLGLLAMVVLVAVYLKRAAKRHLRPAPGSEGKGGKGSKHQESREAYAEHLGFNNDGAPSNDFAMLGLRHPFTRQDVQRAFRAKSLKVHPDHGGDPDFFHSLVSARDRALADADDEEPTPRGGVQSV
jgi:hypothetical protein